MTARGAAKLAPEAAKLAAEAGKLQANIRSGRQHAITEFARLALPLFAATIARYKLAESQGWP